MTMYATESDFRARLGKSGEAIYRDQPDRIAADLAAATAEIDGFLASRYAVPVTADGAQTLLNDWCLTLAEERAYARAGGSSLPDKVTRRADAVRKMLRDAATGLLRLPADPAEASGGVGGAMLVQCDEPLFGRDNMAGY